MHRLLVLVVAATLLSTAGVQAAPAQTSADVATADNAFGFRLLNAVQNAARDGNVVLSPVSAALNLSMVLSGADGKTSQEMLSALSLTGLGPTAINEANANLIKVIRTPARNVALSVADSLWVDSAHASLRPDYIKETHEGYDAEVSDLDFSNPSAVSRINDWASKETQGRISRIIDQIDPVDRLLLVNAVYFKGQWAQQFNKALTQQRDFTLADGSVKQVPRMVQSGNFGYFETPQMQAIRLPFGDGDLVMDILLPAQSSSLDALAADLTVEHWKEWQAHYASRSGTIELPRFELKSTYQLNKPLQALGMKRAFQANAELTRMFSVSPSKSGGGHFFISSVLQSTFWKVDEEGAEAAAVTSTHIHSLAFRRPAEEPFHMIVDRAFFCAIEDRRSGVLLFIGAIRDPRA
jgi:serine protease inhibitor